jgi:thiosulfate/3-mercaptopyruvate sulfurtransferase
MVKVKRIILLVLVVVMISSLLAGCANYDFNEDDQYIVTAKQALDLIEEGVIVVDVESRENYGLSHIEGAINIPMSDLVTDDPYSNMLPDASQIEMVMGMAGITENDTILVYDNSNNMKAARVQWTLNMFGNFNVKVISGGITALKDKKAVTTMTAKVLSETSYKTADIEKSLIVTLDYVKSVINMPDENTLIIDTRSYEEYIAGTIPGACNIEYTWNNYSNGQYKSARDIQITYIDKGVMPDMKIIVFCKTSVRAAQTYTALKNAGYKDVRVYDGAWLEFSDKETPQVPVDDVAPPTSQDAS